MKSISRSAGAMFAGVLAVVVPSIGTDALLHATGVFPPAGQPMGDGLWLLATAYRLIYGVAGGYIAARLAPERPMHHALALGAFGMALSIAGAAATWNEGPAFGPKWFSLGLVATAIPSAWAGARLQIPKTGSY
ncbi:MAG: hypothetical protein ACKV2U_17085 [Bryobacteraceae bacterium]